MVLAAAEAIHPPDTDQSIHIAQYFLGDRLHGGTAVDHRDCEMVI